MFYQVQKAVKSEVYDRNRLSVCVTAQADRIILIDADVRDR